MTESGATTIEITGGTCCHIICRYYETAALPVIPSEVENGAAWGTGTSTRRPEAERRDSERIKSRSITVRLLPGIPRLRFAPLGMTE
jgi:hypothetical protein